MNNTLNARLFTCSAAVWEIKKKFGKNKYSSASYQEVRRCRKQHVFTHERKGRWQADYMLRHNCGKISSAG